MSKHEASEEPWVAPRIIRVHCGVTALTLSHWADKGLIQQRHTPTGKCLYLASEVHRIISGGTATSPESSKINIIYARVSTAKQRDDLERQTSFLRERYPTHTLIADIGSGINWNRRGLQSILDQCLNKSIGEVVVAHRDRLCRIAFGLLETIIQKAGGSIVVLDSNDHSPQQELTEDLCSIIHVFSCRLNGKRKYTVDGESVKAGPAGTGKPRGRPKKVPKTKTKEEGDDQVANNTSR